MQFQKAIEQLGLSPKEAKVYLAALQLGEAHISDIAEKVGMPRSSTQAIVDALHKHGFMNFYVVRRYKYWVAEHPNRFLEHLKQQESMIQEVLPSLVDIRTSHWGKRHKKEHQHEEDINFFHLMADASLHPMLITNEHGGIEYVNAAWEQCMGYTFNEVKGRDSRIFQSNKTPQRVYDQMWKSLRTGSLFQTSEIINVRKNGTLVPIVATYFSLQYHDGPFSVQIFDYLNRPHEVTQ